MIFRQTLIAAVLLLGLAASSMAQSASAPAEAGRNDAGAPAAAAPAVDVSRLPVNLKRIEREFRQAAVREERSGLNLRYFVEVYGQAPPLVVFTKEDNLQFGPVPYGAPTHRDMLWMLTPQEHRGSLYALPVFRIPIGDSKKGK
jgi:hypothetical protein